MYCKTIFLFSLVIDDTLASDNPLRFRTSLLERIWKLIKATDNKNRGEKLKYSINWEATIISAI